ncbi:pentapeptide repeat-containing protein [Streptomyces mirabilis]|uniref:pentapeptide repeat-containing protein n=1 Tax=Streptomyces mirabilis TaxID=68239 RepID=UPI0036AB613A
MTGITATSGPGRLEVLQQQANVRPISWWWTVLGAAVVTAAISISMWALLAQTHGLRGEAEAKARLDAIKTALTVGAGTGGAAALLVSLRRQWLSEHEQVHREAVAAVAQHDATERRITELYTAAANQLGGETAPVRLAGMYALERLAQDHVAHRQTIVNVICSYLRMPLSASPPSATPETELSQLPQRERASRAAQDAAAAASWEQERVVRITAQRILTRHLFIADRDPVEPLAPTPDDTSFWPDIELDLSGATLLYFDFTGIRAKRVDFSNARFADGGNFAHADFMGFADFRGAQFENKSGHFYGAWFERQAVFSKADFGNEQAVFDGATFVGNVFLDDAELSGGVSFEGVRALAEFNARHGQIRRWPPDWIERALAPDEQIPRPAHARWAGIPELPPGDSTWTLVARSPSTA